MKQVGALSRWATFGPALFVMLALGVLPLANLVYTSFHTVTWSGGQATFSLGRPGALSRAPGRSAAACRVLQHHRLRGVRGGRPDAAGLHPGAAVQPRQARAGALSRAVHPADPHSRHRHRRDLEADAQLRLRPDQPDHRPGRDRGPELAGRQGDRARLGDRRRHLALDAVLLPAAAGRPRIAAAGSLRGGQDRWRHAGGRSCATSPCR